MAFLGLFGNYDKPGPGVDKDEPKKAAPVRFFEILWRKLSKLVQLNLTFMIPFIVVIALMVGVFLLPIPHFLYATSFFGVLDLYILYAVTLPLILLSPFTCGLAYVTQKLRKGRACVRLVGFLGRCEKQLEAGTFERRDRVSRICNLELFNLLLFHTCIGQLDVYDPACSLLHPVDSNAVCAVLHSGYDRHV